MANDPSRTLIIEIWFAYKSMEYLQSILVEFISAEKRCAAQGYRELPGGGHDQQLMPADCVATKTPLRHLHRFVLARLLHQPSLSQLSGTKLSRRQSQYVHDHLSCVVSRNTM